jgi:hypothetical protein
VVAAAARRLEEAAAEGKIAAPLYKEDDIVRLPDLHVIAIVTRVHKSIGTLPRYDVTDEDGDKHEYLPEYKLYPDILKAR